MSEASSVFIKNSARKYFCTFYLISLSMLNCRFSSAAAAVWEEIEKLEILQLALLFLPGNIIGKHVEVELT